MRAAEAVSAEWTKQALLALQSRLTPADFFNKQHIGKYFLISPLAAGGETGAK